MFEDKVLEDQLSRDQQKQAKCRAALSRRKDYLPTDQAPNIAAIPRERDSHELKMERYRDRLLTSVTDKIPADLFNQLADTSLAVLGTMSPNSEIALFADLLSFIDVCNTQQLPPFPIDDINLDYFLTYWLGTRQSVRTLERKLSNFAKWHERMSLDDPRKTSRIHDRINRLKRQTRSAPKQAQGLRENHLRKAVDASKDSVLRDVADLTLLFVAFWTLCRRSELVAINWPDIHFEPDGSGQLHLPFSKSDQTGEGQYRYLSQLTCDLLRYWQKVSGQTTGAVFRGIYSNATISQRLDVKGVNRAFKRLAKKIGISPALISGHSTRVGSLQEMLENGINDSAIMLAGGWASERMIVVYGRKLAAKKSGTASLEEQLGLKKLHSTDDSGGVSIMTTIKSTLAITDKAD